MIKENATLHTVLSFDGKYSTRSKKGKFFGKQESINTFLKVNCPSIRWNIFTSITEAENLWIDKSEFSQLIDKLRNRDKSVYYPRFIDESIDTDAAIESLSYLLKVSPNKNGWENTVELEWVDDEEIDLISKVNKIRKALDI